MGKHSEINENENEVDENEVNENEKGNNHNKNYIPNSNDSSNNNNSNNNHNTNNNNNSTISPPNQTPTSSGGALLIGLIIFIIILVLGFLYFTKMHRIIGNYLISRKNKKNNTNNDADNADNADIYADTNNDHLHIKSPAMNEYSHPINNINNMDSLLEAGLNNSHQFQKPNLSDSPSINSQLNQFNIQRKEINHIINNNTIERSSMDEKTLILDNNRHLPIEKKDEIK
ncbi:unnamed protein product [Cunninghamella blakesleeana]